MVPPWQGTFEDWSRKWVKANFWRVRHLFLQQSDALQECALIFCRVANRYGNKVDNPRWFMALYKTAVHNNWIVFSLRDYNMRVAIQEAAERQYADGEGVDFNLGPALVRLKEAKPELRQALMILGSATPSEVRELFGNNSRISINKRMSEAVGGKKFDFVAEMHRLPPSAIPYRHLTSDKRIRKRPMRIPTTR